MSNYKAVILTLAMAIFAPLAAWAGPVNINTADAATLAQELKGVGASRAQAIVAYREKNGAFESADGLADVKGVTLRIVEMNRENIRIASEKSD